MFNVALDKTRSWRNMVCEYRNPSATKNSPSTLKAVCASVHDSGAWSQQKISVNVLTSRQLHCSTPGLLCPQRAPHLSLWLTDTRVSSLEHPQDRYHDLGQSESSLPLTYTQQLDSKQVKDLTGWHVDSANLYLQCMWHELATLSLKALRGLRVYFLSNVRIWRLILSSWSVFLITFISVSFLITALKFLCQHEKSSFSHTEAEIITFGNERLEINEE